MPCQRAALLITSHYLNPIVMRSTVLACFVVTILVSGLACSDGKDTARSIEVSGEPTLTAQEHEQEQPYISTYVSRIYNDSRGNYWFGTNSKC